MLNRAVSQVLSKGRFEQRYELSEGESHVKSERRTFQTEGTVKTKGLRQDSFWYLRKITTNINSQYLYDTKCQALV